MAMELAAHKQQKMLLDTLITSYKSRKKTLENSRLSQKVFDYVVEKISEGTFKPGSKLVERELASQLCMSHVPVREAMEKLEQHGWVYRIDRRGAFVMDFDKKRLKEAYQIREIIEAGAAYLLAMQKNPEQLQELKKITEILESASETRNAEVFEKADTQFHRLIVHFADNQRLEDIFNSVLLQADAYFMIFWVTARNTFMKTGKKASYVDPMSHTAIYKAIEAGNAELAEELTRKHIQHSYKTISQMMRIREELSE